MSEEFSDDEFEFDDATEEQEQDQETFEGEVDEVAGSGKSAEDLEKQRLARAEQKRQTKERRLQKPNSELIIEAKSIWEQLRQKRLTKAERRSLMDDMMELVGGKALEIIYKHDASRIVQCCIKYGSPEQRDSVAQELSGHYASLSQSKYGRFIVSKILQYCSTSFREKVIQDFHGKVRKLIRHKEASVILDEVYSQYANSAQRTSLMEEFYGPEFAVFKNEGSTRTLPELLKAQPLKKAYILKHLRSAIDSVLEKAAFNVGKTPILHRAILDYLTVSEPSVYKDMIELLKDHLVHILHTREGAQIVQLCILHAGPKDRKYIIKSFKGFVHSIAKEQYGHAVLISCFECIDDTVLVGKAILSELFKPVSQEFKMNELLRDVYGSRVILYLLCGRNRRYQPSYLINELESYDSVRAETTKKEPAVRHEQLLEVVSPLLITEVALYVNELLRDKNGSLVIVETCAIALGDKSEILTAVLKQIESGCDLESIEFAMEESEEPVNVVKKMKAEADAQKQADQGLDMTESVLLSRSSALAIKLLISKSKTNETPLEWKSEFCQNVWDIISGSMKLHLEHCAQDPKRTAGLAFIYVALFENGGSELQKQIKKAAGAEKSLVKDLKKQVEKSIASAPEPPKSKNSKKRKHDNDKPFKSGIQIFLDLIQ